MRTATGCTRCGSTIQPGQRFCGECGSPAALECSSCAAPITADTRYCPSCGVAITARSGPRTPPFGAEDTPAEATPPGDGPPGAGDVSPAPDGGPLLTSWRHVEGHLRAALRGEFAIEREIGRGGMAAVYLARELRLNRWVALKVMAPALLSGVGMIERFRQEAVTVANLSHANIVTIHSVRDVDDLHLFVMEFIEGRALDRILHEERRLPLPAVRSILFQVGSALSYAHRRGVVHRDVKPANILMDTSGDAIVTDFGIAKVAESSAHTQTGMLIGTPTYMSPEQCLGTPVSAASDQYALGIVAYELLVGHVPFTGPSLAVLQAHLGQTPRSPDELVPDCPPDVAAAVMRMLAKDPADRWPSIAQAVAAIGGSALGETDPLRRTLAELAGAPPAAVPAAVELSLPSGSWEAGDALLAKATVRATDGTPLPEVAVRWSSDAPEIARVDAVSGRVALLAPGTATLQATTGEVHGEAVLTVATPRAVALTVDSPPDPLFAGDSWRPTIAVLDRRGALLDLPARCTCSDPQVASVSEDGVVEALAAGSAVVLVTVDQPDEALEHEVPLTVRPALVASIELETPATELEEGERLQCVATPRDRRGRPLAHAIVSWRSDAPHVATVDETGVVHTREAGHATIRATSEGRRATAALHVRPARVTALEIVAPALTLRVGERTRLTAVARDARGEVRERPVRWSSANADVLQVGPDGRAEARAMGAARVEVECEGVRASAELWVVVASVTALFAAPTADPPLPAVAAPEPAAPPRPPVIAPVATDVPGPTAEIVVRPLPEAAGAPRVVVPEPEPAVATPALEGPGAVTQEVEPVRLPTASRSAAARVGAPRMDMPSGDAQLAPPSRRLLVIALAVAALLALGGWWATRDGTPPPATGPGVTTVSEASTSASEPARPASAAPGPSASPAAPPAPVPEPVKPTPERPDPTATRPVAPPASASPSSRRAAQELAEAEAARRRATAPVTGPPRPSTPTPEEAPSTPPTRVATITPPPVPTTPLPAREPAEAPPDPAVAAAASASEARAGMQRALSAYVAAIGARNVGDLQRAFPTMPENVRRGWESLFAATRSIDAGTSDVKLAPSGVDAGTAEFALTVGFDNPVSRRPCRQVTQLRARLARAGGAWRITGLDQLGNSSSGAGCRG